MTVAMKQITAALAAACCMAAAADGAAAPGLVGPGAAEPNPFSELVGKKHERRSDRAGRVKIERYVLASDDRAFLFEDRSGEARVKFLCGPNDPRLDCTLDPQGQAAEIYELTATRGPRGDVFYKTAEGDTMLRIASYGGATVFWPGEAQGLAASKSFGDDEALRLAEADFEAAKRRAQSATAIISALTGAPIIFDVGSPSSAEEEVDASVLADAVVRAAKGVKDVADDPTGARILASRIGRVSFAAADAPGVGLEGEALAIRYVPGGDVEDRPSSAAVARFLEESL